MLKLIYETLIELNLTRSKQRKKEIRCDHINMCQQVSSPVNDSLHKLCDNEKTKINLDKPRFILDK